MLYLDYLMYKAVCAALRGGGSEGITQWSSKIQDTFQIFPAPVFFLAPIGNGHWRTQARHHLLHHSGCIHHQR